MSDRIIISPYNPEWPAWFAQVAALVAPVLTVPHVIEHVGSTSVPGLDAKSIIDLDIVIKRRDFPGARDGLATLGYQHQGDLGIPDREAFKQIDEERKKTLPPHHLYVCISGAYELRKHLLFRDYLRTHPEDARHYAALKYRLAEQYGEDRAGYTEAKGPFIWAIMRKADAWAQEKTRQQSR